MDNFNSEKFYETEQKAENARMSFQLGDIGKKKKFWTRAKLPSVRAKKAPKLFEFYTYSIEEMAERMAQRKNMKDIVEAITLEGET